MKRVMLTVAIVALVAGVAIAQCGDCGDTQMIVQRPRAGGMQGAGEGQMHKPMQDAMMPPMAALAVYGGNIYIIDGDTLKKLGADMAEIGSVELDIECAGPMRPAARGEGGQGMEQGAGPQGRGQQQMQRPRTGMRGGTGMQGGPRMQSGAGMHPDMMAGCGGLQLAADASGVYVLHHGTLTRYDHHLRKMESKDVMKRPRMMGEGAGMRGEGMMQRPRQQRGMRPRQGRDEGGMGQGRGGQHAPVAQRRSIDGGEVTFGHLPPDLSTGQIDLRIHVLDINGNYDTDAEVSAFLYPKDNLNAGRRVALQTHRDGRFMAMTTIHTPGTWELAVRVARPAMEDAKVYFPLQVTQ
ncbi:MAG: hypothetical protein ACLFWB_00680 [Armatimonadota bacterium]